MKKNTERFAAGERLPVNEYLALMAREVDGLGWDAILVYDRFKTNVILLQEYIQRFGEDSWFPPATFDADTTPGVIERVIDYRFDKPRLSFANANLESSRLDLIMKVVGGKQLTIENPANKKLRQVTRIKMADALNGPVLRARVSLEEVNVEVSDGRVGIDLSKGTAYELSFADTPIEDAVGGESVKKVFEDWLGEEKIFELSQMPRTDNLMKPEYITIRTQASADSNVLGAASEGDGAVLVFVAMEGNGSALKLPAKTFSYFLPGMQGEFSAAMIFSQGKIFERVAPVIIRNMDYNGIEFFAEYRDGVITATTGGRVRLRFYREYDDFTIYDRYFGGVFSDQRAENGHFGKLELRLDDGALSLRWEGSAEYNVRYYNHGSKASDRGVFTAEHTLGYVYDLAPDAEGVISFRVKSRSFNSSMGVKGFSNNGFAARVLEGSGDKDYFDNSLVPEVVGGFDNLNTEVDTFLLHNLLFRGEQVFRTISTHTAGSIVTLGQLDPDLTTFQIDPVEKVVGAGRTFPFTTTGANVPVTWSVDNLPDGSGDAGTIDSETGVYTAPPWQTCPTTTSEYSSPRQQKRVVL